MAPDNVGPEDDPELRRGVRRRRRGRSGAAARRSSARSTIRSSSTSGTIFDGINIDKPGRPNIGLGNQGGGKDDVAGYNTHGFVLQVPEAAGHARRQGRVGREAPRTPSSACGRRPSASRLVGHAAKPGRRQRSRHGWVQVSRLGNPLINEVVIPIGQKDRFNRTSPADDAANFGKYALKPELARLLNALFNLGVKETDRTDIVQALLTGVPGLTQIGDQRRPPADTLKLNLGVPPAADAEPLRRARRRHRPGSRTAAASPTTSSTSSCA